MHTRHNPPTGRGLILGDALHTRIDHTNPLNSSPNRPPNERFASANREEFEPTRLLSFLLRNQPVMHWNASVSPRILTWNEIIFPKFRSVHFPEFWFRTDNLGNRTGSSVTSSRFSLGHWFAFPIQAKEFWTNVMWLFSSICGSRKETGLTEGPQSRVHPSSISSSTTVTFGASLRYSRATSAG